METILGNRVKENSPNAPKVSTNPRNRVRDPYGMGERSLNNGIEILEEWDSNPSPRWVVIGSYRFIDGYSCALVPNGTTKKKTSTDRRTS